MEKGTWVEYNPNPDTTKYTRGKKKGKKVSHSDCVIRAFCKLYKEDWLTIYKMLCERGAELFDMPNNEKVWKSFLTQNKNFITKNSSGMLTVSEVAGQTEGKRGTYICRVQNHIVAINNGKYYDSWDSGREKVYTVWEK